MELKSKRAQSSLEYLMTYGWAIIILVAVLSVLYSLGVFDPQQYMNEECLFQPSLQCKSMSLKTNGEFELKLSNGLGYTLESVNASVNVLSTGESIQSTTSQVSVDPNSDIVVRASLKNTGTFRVGTIEKVKITINYELNEKEYSTSGIVAVRVSPSK
ncbi:MAG: hypothetical protein ACP5H8_01555 [Candidatus Micrarchaeia archaeon]